MSLHSDSNSETVGDSDAMSTQESIHEEQQQPAVAAKAPPSLETNSKSGGTDWLDGFCLACCFCCTFDALFN